MRSFSLVLVMLLVLAGVACSGAAASRSPASPTPPSRAPLAPAASSPRPSTWGALTPGSFAVGFRQVVFDDPSRAYRLHVEADSYPRPVVAGVWYPARPQTGTVLRLGDYFELRLPRPERSEFSAIFGRYLLEMALEESLHHGSELLGPEEREAVERVFGEPTFGRRDATLAVASAPMLLAHTGLGGVYADNMVLYEYLASHGWIVVAGLFQQSTGYWLNVDWDPARSIRDLDVLRERVPSALGFEPERVAIIGHSYGAQAALVYSTLPDRVDAVVSLDSTMENADPDDPWWRNEDHGPWLDRGAGIRVPTMVVANAGRDPTYLQTTRAERREYLTVDGFEHNDFEGLGGVLRPRLDACPSTTACQRLHRQYLALVSVVARFLDSAVRPSYEHPPGPEEAELEALGFVRTRLTGAIAERSSPVPPLPDLDLSEPDCRVTEEECDPTVLAFAHATELLALDRAEQGLVLIDVALRAQPGRLDLLDLRGRLLVALDRYEEATAQFECIRAHLAALEEPSPQDEYYRDQAEERRDRARARGDERSIAR